MKIAILGAGAVGGLVAWHLARAGHRPVVVARAETAARLAHEGLTLVTPTETITVALEATADPARLGHQDLVVAGLKGQDWPAALGLARPLIGPDTMLVPMMNGIPWWYFQGLAGPFADRRIDAVDPDGALAAAIPPGAIIGGVAYVGVSRESPTRLVWNTRNRFVLGEATGPVATGPVAPRLEALVGLLRAAGLGAEASPDIRAEIWRKLLGNTTYNPLSVVTDATIGRLATDPPLRRIVRLIMEETAAVAKAVGITRAFDLDERLVVAPAMRDFRTSMWQDFQAGRPLELGGIVEAVLELGRATGVPTPTLETVGALAAERHRARHGAGAAQPLARGARSAHSPSSD